MKIACLVAGMTAGADSIDDMDVLRHGAMPALFGGIRAPSTLGSFLRSFTWGNVLQLEQGAPVSSWPGWPAGRLLPGADVLAFIDIDSQQKRVYGHAKQGAAFGHTKIQGKSLLVRGLNALAATICTPLAAPVIAATRLRGGNAASARGAASLIAEAIGTARAAGCTGRSWSGWTRRSTAPRPARRPARPGAFLCHRPHGPQGPRRDRRHRRGRWTRSATRARSGTTSCGCWVSDAEVAETPYTAFTSKERARPSPPG